jgi:hypothetical protein
MRSFCLIAMGWLLWSTDAFVGCRPVKSSPFLPAINLLRLNAENSDSLTKEETSEKKMATPLDRPLLALVDAAALTAFAAVGKASHTGPGGSMELGAVLQTALPFYAAWFSTSPLTGVYQATSRQRSLALATLQQVAVGWVVAIPLGCVFRGLIKGYVPPLPFVIVTLVATLVMLSVARIAFAVVEDFFVELVN